jgi:hypothetical protein
MTRLEAASDVPPAEVVEEATGAEALEELDASRPATGPKVVLVCDEWRSRRGGISTFNRELAAALAGVGCRVAVFVPSAESSELDDASTRGVELVSANPIPGLDGNELLLPGLLYRTVFNRM